MFEYSNKLIQALEQLFLNNEQTIQQASQMFADAIIHDNMIQILGTGHSHMIGLEGFIRAGGLGNINAILDSTVLTSDGALRGSKLEKLSGLAEILWQEQNINEHDVIVVVSNSGRNASRLSLLNLLNRKATKLSPSLQWSNQASIQVVTKVDKNLWTSQISS